MMNRLLCIAALVAASCASPMVVSSDSAIGRQSERVVVRHDAYVEADDTLESSQREAYLGDSMLVRTMLALPEMDLRALEDAMDPVMDRHDAYVLEADLDDFERATYLGTTETLRGLFDELPEID